MYDIVADSPTDEELEFLEMVAPELATGHYDHCPTCAKMGIYRWRGVEYPCDCATQLALAQRYTLAGIPANYWRLGPEDYVADVPADVLDYQHHADGYLANGMGLMLLGLRGVGKTMLLMLILKKQVREGRQCYATTFATLSDHITAGWGKGDLARAAALRFAERFEHSEHLLLDDLGKEFKSSNSLSANTFDRVLRTRVQNKRATSLSSNLGLPEITSGYGEGVFSLLVEQSVPVIMTGADYRAVAQQRNRHMSRTGERPPIQ